MALNKTKIDFEPIVYPKQNKGLAIYNDIR
jgi:hypothetical protein